MVGRLRRRRTMVTGGAAAVEDGQHHCAPACHLLATLKY
jgi:hypothetical protein